MPSRPRRLPFFVPLIAALAVSAQLAWPAAATEAPEIDWSDTARDFYVDGELEAAAVFLTASSEATGDQLAVLSEALERAYIVDLETLEVIAVPLDHFALQADGGATSPHAGEIASQGRATRINDRRSTFYVVGAAGHTLVIAPHQGPTGTIEAKDLLAAVPTWQRRLAGYEPDPRAVAALATYPRDVELTVAFGTWCGDSRNYVPKLLAALEAAHNPHIGVDLVAIARGFEQPSEVVLGQRITNVPTVIVRQAGLEIGRFVETPVGDSVEGDVAAILDGDLGLHPGRWSREAEIARGRYVFEDAGERLQGEERWVLYRTEGGGSLLHSRTLMAGDEVETWHRRDPNGASDFVELTRRHGDELSRTRIWIEDSELRALTRGNVTGIVDQRLSIPSGTGVLLPCAAEAGFGWAPRAGASADGSPRAAYLLPSDHPTAGKVVALATTTGGVETIDTELGPRPARRLATRLDGGEAEWWIDETLGVPLRGRSTGLGRVTLAELSLPADPAPTAP